MFFVAHEWAQEVQNHARVYKHFVPTALEHNRNGSQVVQC